MPIANFGSHVHLLPERTDRPAPCGSVSFRGGYSESSVSDATASGRIRTAVTRFSRTESTLSE